MGLMQRVLSAVRLNENDSERQLVDAGFKVAECKPDDCEGCSEKYPASMSIDTTSPLWDSAKPFSLQLLVATGKTDWLHAPSDERGSVLEALNDGMRTLEKTLTTVHPNLPSVSIKLSASSLSPPDEYFESDSKTTDVLILPYFRSVRVSPANAVSSVAKVIEQQARAASGAKNGASDSAANSTGNGTNHEISNGASNGSNGTASNGSSNGSSNGHSNGSNGADITTTITDTIAKVNISAPSQSSNLCTRDAVILICSHRTRDKRCGITAPILRKTFDRELRHSGLYRDFDDDRPGGANVAYVSHVGGHKFSANVIIHFKSGQVAWLARVRPEHVGAIVQGTLTTGELMPDLLRQVFRIDW